MLRKSLAVIIIFFSIFSCSKQEIQLPEASFNSPDKIEDVSSAFVFYNDKTGNASFNDNNLISTTNWIINIDKRLTLGQAMPFIQQLQTKHEKKGMHKNDSAQTFLSGYNTKAAQPIFINISKNRYNNGSALANFTNSGRILNFSDKIFMSFTKEKVTILNDEVMTTTTLDDFHKIVFKFLQKSRVPKKVFSSYHEALSYQEFFKIKSTLENIEFINGELAQNEFIYK